MWYRNQKSEIIYSIKDTIMTHPFKKSRNHITMTSRGCYDVPNHWQNGSLFNSVCTPAVKIIPVLVRGIHRSLVDFPLEGLWYRNRFREKHPYAYVHRHICWQLCGESNTWTNADLLSSGPERWAISRCYLPMNTNHTVTFLCQFLWNFASVTSLKRHIYNTITTNKHERQN